LPRIGIGLDYGRADHVQRKMQTDLNAALIATVKDVDDLGEAEAGENILTRFAAQADYNSIGFPPPIRSRSNRAARSSSNSTSRTYG